MSEARINDAKKVAQLIDTLSIEQKVGQLFVLAYAGEDSDYAHQLVKQFHIGGFYITDDNAHSCNNARQLATSLQEAAALRACDAPLLLAVDQEGAWGILTQETNLGPGNMGLGKADNLDDTQTMYRIFAQQMQEIGYNTLLSPCADVNSNPDNPIIGQRAFGKEAKHVALHVTAAVNGIKSTGNLSCAKHFPGHGDTALDSHRTLPVVDKSLDELMESDLLPFKAAIEQGVSLVMTAHINYPQIDANAPATLSHTILTQLLKEKLGFQGLIITDSMNMWAMRRHYDPVDAAICSFKAGAHLIMLSEEHYENEATDYKKVQQDTIMGVIEAVKQGQLSEALLDERLHKVLSYRYRHIKPYALATPLTRQFCQSHSAQVANKAIKIVRNQQDLFPLGDETFQLAFACPPNNYDKLVNSRGIGPNDATSAGEYFRNTLSVLGARFTLIRHNELVEMLSDPASMNLHSPLVIVTEDYPLPGEDIDTAIQVDLVKKAIELCNDKLIVIALRGDEELRHYSNLSTYICSYSSRKDSAISTAKQLIKQR